MPVIQLQKRNPISQLDDLLLKTLYENVLLLCEAEEKLICNNTKASQWVKFEKSNKVRLIHNHEKEKEIFKTSKDGILTIDSKYTQQDISDTIIFTNKQNHVFSGLFSHIRNAFAHNQIFVDGEYITMYDRLNQNSSVFTMIAHIKIEVLKELIETIKNIKK